MDKSSIVYVGDETSWLWQVVVKRRGFLKTVITACCDRGNSCCQFIMWSIFFIAQLPIEKFKSLHTFQDLPHCKSMRNSIQSVIMDSWTPFTAKAESKYYYIIDIYYIYIMRLQIQHLCLITFTLSLKIFYENAADYLYHIYNCLDIALLRDTPKSLSPFSWYYVW